MPLRPDVEIRQDVECALKSDPAVDEHDIAVKVINGEVTLTGYVHDFSQKYAAENAVKRVTDVSAIANDIEPRTKGAISDPEIARAAVAALNRDVPLRSRSIVRPTLLLDGSAFGAAWMRTSPLPPVCGCATCAMPGSRPAMDATRAASERGATIWRAPGAPAPNACCTCV